VVSNEPSSLTQDGKIATSSVEEDEDVEDDNEFVEDASEDEEDIDNGKEEVAMHHACLGQCNKHNLHSAHVGHDIPCGGDTHSP